MGLFSLLFVAAFLTESSFITNSGSLPNTPPVIPTSAAAVDEPYTGTGNAQEVRVYSTFVNNSLNTNGSFPIDSPSSNSRLTGTALNYTFKEDFTTLHQVTPYSALDYPRVLNGTWLNFAPGRLADAIIPTTYTGNFTEGTWANWDWAHDNNPWTFSNYSSSGGAVSFDVFSDFSNLFVDSWVFPGTGNLILDQSMCEGLELNFMGNVSGSGITSVGYTIQAWKWGTGWQPVGTGQVLNTTSTLHATIINPGTDYINATMGSHFRVTISSASFNLTLCEANATVKMVQELEISDTKQVAMSFDLLGNATVRGFQVLIRTIGTPSGSVTLNAGLYRANWTFPSETIDTMDKAAVPVGSPLATYTSPINSVFNGIITFNFSTPASCNISNYFIVISSSSSTVFYRIAAVPRNAGTKHGEVNSFPVYTDVDPDLKVRHILLNSSSGFGEHFWNQSYLGNDPQTQLRLNAAPFAINLSRGWVPSDVNMSIQNILLTGADYTIAHEVPFNGTPGWYWGRGFWNSLLPSPISNIGWRIDVPLTWDQSKSQTIFFNVTFQAAAYAVEYVVPTFNITATTDPLWIINHTIAAGAYANWTFDALALVYPKTWNSTSLRLLNPSYAEVIASLSDANDTYYLHKATNATSILGVFGQYSFQVRSYNAIKRFQSHLNWNNTNYWETDSFMRGDNISVEFGAQIAGAPVRNGDANTTLFDPYGARLPAPNGTLAVGGYDQIKTGLTYYRYSNVNLYNTTLATPRGEYTAISKWFNGTEVGFNHTHVYIINYTPQIQSVDYDPDFGINFAEGISGQDANRDNSFDLTITTVNETTGKPRNFLPLKNWTTGSASNVFEYIRFQYANINETVFQRGEQFEVNISIQSLYGVADIDVKVKFELVHYTRQEWRIFEATSDTITLHQWGQEGNEVLINMTGTFPATDATGLNCPIRKGPILMKLTFFVSDRVVGSWSPKTPFIQVDGTDLTFEGQILTGYLLNNHDGMTFIAPLNRTEGVNVPGITHYFVSVMDSYGLSTETNSSLVVFGKALATFENVASLPLVPTVNRFFNLSGNLVSENPSLNLTGKNVTFQIFNAITHIWSDLLGVDAFPNVTTGADGYFTKAFNASMLGLSNLVRASYAGDDQHLAGTFNYTLTVIQYNHVLQVLVDPHLQISGNRQNYVAFWFFNSGNSTLENLQITVKNSQNYTMQVIEADYVAERSLGAGVTLIRAYLVIIPPLTAPTNATFTFTITATVKETLQQITFEKSLTIGVQPGNLINFNLESLPAILFWLVAIVVWIGTFVFFVRKRRAMKAAPSAPKRKFVQVGPAPQIPAEKVTEVPFETKPAPPKPAAKDFDEILKEVKKDEDENSE